NREVRGYRGRRAGLSRERNPYREIIPGDGSLRRRRPAAGTKPRSADDAQACDALRARYPQLLPGRHMTRFHLHLVSDSTGDTVHSVARACLVQFEGAEAIEHIWSMVRTKTQIERVITGVEVNPGVVLYTLVDETLRQPLVDGCRRL